MRQPQLLLQRLHTKKLEPLMSMILKLLIVELQVGTPSTPLQQPPLDVRRCKRWLHFEKVLLVLGFQN
jgi:hypothetical protein